MKRRVLSVFTLVGLGLLLAACGLFTKKEPPPGPCSRAVILGDAEHMVQFRDGPGRDILDISYSGRLIRIFADCEYEMNKDRTGVMSVRVYLAIEAERGPVNRDRIASYRYFVTLTDAQREPVSKNVFDLAAQFPGNVTRMVLTDDTVEMKVPIGAGQSGKNFTIFVGFQLSDEQLEFNRRTRLDQQRAR
ncbi:MAG: hypothetical protein EXR02_01750 [Rhodospirillales bacterium]|nr:hypothetical protein [Rhodospirillales bacterium]MSP79777.1 hypothetical protein [Rhodospirillales bacterium]